MPTNSISSPPARIAKASKPTTKSNPDVFSIKLNPSPIKSNHRYLLIAESLPTMGKRRKNQLSSYKKSLLSSSLFPKHPSVKSVKPYTLLRCLSSYFANSRSIAAISSGESGPTLLRNRATTSPCLLTKNFSKFQETSPLGSAALVSLAYSGCC